MHSSPHVYVVDNDRVGRDELCASLQDRGIEATAIGATSELLARLQVERPDLIVLDIGPPGMSGLQVCKRLRSEGSSVPIVLTAQRSDGAVRALGLEMGADDFLDKPFLECEMLARIDAVLRRARSSVPSLAEPSRSYVTIGDSVFDLDAHCLVGQHEQLALSKIAFAVLRELVAHPLLPVSRERLMSVAYGQPKSPRSRSVDMTVHRLRRFLEPDPENPRFIHTVHGLGYRFMPEPVDRTGYLGRIASAVPESS
jgi:two-component system, OmpR family, phosphate regulon response regulator OmpR